MNESYVTLQGWVGNDVDVRDVGDTQCASFRVGSTPRYNKGGTWVDGQTSWYTVNCWRGLGKNVGDSIRRGDAVVVHGRVRVDVWEREGQPASVTWVVDATFVATFAQYRHRPGWCPDRTPTAAGSRGQFQIRDGPSGIRIHRFCGSQCPDVGSRMGLFG